HFRGGTAVLALLRGAKSRSSTAHASGADPLYSSSAMTGIDIAPARGRLGVLLVGLGSVSTTTIAGVLAIRKGMAPPVASLTQMGTVRLGKRTEGRSPKITDVVPLSSLDDLVFGGWDIFDEDCYAAARTAGVIDGSML